MDNKYAALISVIVPVFNTEAYLDRCLTSILSNTWHNLEVICIDDGSTDSSLDVLEKLSRKDKRVKIIKQKNSGVSSARNNGLKEFHGEYVTFIDSDDWIHRQYFELLMRCITELNADLVCCKYLRTSGSNADVQIYNSEQISEYSKRVSKESLFYNYHMRTKCWGKLYKKSMVEDLKFPENVVLGEDTIFVMDYLSRFAGKIVVCDKPLYFYYDRADSAVNTADENTLIQTVDYYLSVCGSAQDELLNYYLRDGMKKMLYCRYNILIKNKAASDELIEKCNLRLQKLLHRARSVINKKEYCLYSIFYKSPSIYRAFRIMNDPSMLRYERTVKNIE